MRRLAKLKNTYDPSIENPYPFITLAMRENLRDDGLVQPLDDDDFYYQELELHNRKAKDQAAAELEQGQEQEPEVEVGMEMGVDQEH